MDPVTPNEAGPDPALSVVIVNWNTRGLLAACLRSVAAELGSLATAAETLVVDNASRDGSARMVQEQFPWVQLLENQANLGFAGGNNQAIARSRGRYALLLNPDTEVRPGAVRTLLDFMESRPQAGAAGARLLNPDGTLQPSCYPAPSLSRELWRLFHMDALHPYGVYRMADWPLDQPRPADVLQGACLIVRRTALDEVGPLDEGYFMYSEEVDFCHRLRQAGWQLYWVPGAQVVHYGGQSTQQAAAEMFLQLYQGKIRYFRKHYGWPAAQAYKLILLAAALARLAISPLAWLEAAPRRQEHLRLAGHYRRLLFTLPGM